MFTTGKEAWPRGQSPRPYRRRCSGLSQWPSLLPQAVTASIKLWTTNAALVTRKRAIIAPCADFTLRWHGMSSNSLSECILGRLTSHYLDSKHSAWAPPTYFTPQQWRHCLPPMLPDLGDSWQNSICLLARDRWHLCEKTKIFSSGFGSPSCCRSKALRRTLSFAMTAPPRSRTPLREFGHFCASKRSLLATSNDFPAFSLRSVASQRLPPSTRPSPSRQSASASGSR